jgi:hypothetical protein
MGLSSFSIDNAKPADKPYKLSDGDGLHLLVQPGGSKPREHPGDNIMLSVRPRTQHCSQPIYDLVESCLANAWGLVAPISLVAVALRNMPQQSPRPL